MPENKIYHWPEKLTTQLFISRSMAYYTRKTIVFFLKTFF